ncbi:MAG TPA: cobalamin-binding protein [Candidatus Methylomirabilis sp.]|nr:cobalamin-binding protein [Candidatus Methylomirabilis sp.]
MQTRRFRDALGREVSVPVLPRRVVSLIPSVTEICFALGAGDRVVGVTSFCTEPPAGVAEKVRVGGEKNPDLERIRRLRPDLVIANVEENRKPDVDALAESDIPVYVIYPRGVGEGITLLRTLGELLGVPAAGEAQAARVEAALEEVRRLRAGCAPLRVFCPIWKNPWMACNRDTYVHDVLVTCGGENITAERPERYPRVTLEEVAAAAPEVILLPDEPFRFGPKHLPLFSVFPGMPAVRDGRLYCIDGKWISWYGPRMAEGLPALTRVILGLPAAPGGPEAGT